MTRPSSRWAVPLLLLAAGAAASAVGLRSFVLLHDEGLVLQAAARMADGEWPYRDFWWNYGPGQPALLAALEPLTSGPSLLSWRLVRIATDAGVAVTAWSLARRHVGPGWALGAWAATLLLFVVARLPHPNASVALLALGGIWLAASRPRIAGALAGIALVFRPEIGVFAVAAVTLAAPGRRALVAGVALLVGIVGWLPFVLAAGPGAVLGQTLGFDLGVQALQRLSLLPSLPARAEPLAILHAGLPLLLLCGAAAALVAVAIGARRGTASPELLAVAPLLAGGLLYLAGRADLFHVVSLAAVLPLALALLGGAGRGLRGPAGILCAGLLALLLLDGADRRLQLARAPTAGLAAAPAPAGDGVRMDAADVRGLATIRRALDARAPDGPIWVANPRHDRIRAGATLAYVLLDRPSGARYDVQQPGVVTQARAQREIVADLRRGDVPVVQWLDPSGAAPEANAAGRGGGARILDAELERGYRPVAQEGSWRLLLPDGL